MSGTARPDVRVLICDDYAPMRELLRSIIELQPGVVVAGEAGDGFEAIAEASRLQPEVILLDLAMPRKTGLEALREIRQTAPDSKVVIFSGFSISAIGSELLELGAVSYLQKGASSEAIIDAIESAALHMTPDTALAGKSSSGD